MTCQMVVPWTVMLIERFRSRAVSASCVFSVESDTVGYLSVSVRLYRFGARSLGMAVAKRSAIQRHHLTSPEEFLERSNRMELV